MGYPETLLLETTGVGSTQAKCSFCHPINQHVYHTARPYHTYQQAFNHSHNISLVDRHNKLILVL